MEQADKTRYYCIKWQKVSMQSFYVCHVCKIDRVFTCVRLFLREDVMLQLDWELSITSLLMYDISVKNGSNSHQNDEEATDVL